MRKIISYSLFFAISCSCLGQQNKIDSLLTLLAKEKVDTNKIKILLQVAKEEFNSDKLVFYCDSAINLSGRINYKKAIGDANVLEGRYYLFQNIDYSKAAEKFYTSLKIREEINDIKGISNSYFRLGQVYSSVQNNEKSIEYLKKAISINEKQKYYDMLPYNWGTMGLVYQDEMKFDSALYYYNKAITLKLKNGKCPDVDYINVAELFINKREFDSAFYYCSKSDSCYYLNNNYQFGHNWTNAIKGKIFLNQGENKQALPLLLSSFEYANKKNIGELITEVVDPIRIAFESLEDYKNAYRFQKINDSLIKNQNVNTAMAIQAKYEIEKQEKVTKLEEDKKDALTKQEKELTELKQFWTEIVCIIIFLALASIAFVIYKRYKAKKKTNEELMAKNLIIAEKNKDITDSINYAKNIQEAILPAKEIKYKLFPDAFVLFQPKDVVSGDFYWFAEKNGKRIIAAVDCTGHGVPGGFMSMLGNAFLNEIVNQRGITQPSEILSELRFNIIRALKQSGKEGATKDGMDIALLSFDDKNNAVEFAGAYNPLLLLRKENGTYKMEEYLADKRPIGYYLGKGLPFTNQKINLHKGDTLYIFSDGYADQFGGPKGKKFKYKQLQEVLLSIQNEPMVKQEEILFDTFKKWKGSLEQIDDMLVIGIRV
ncbi:MAG: SpoIIE family protein phosphatase [Bacteroidetes bacterium]|nr:SpoIIE family protein phosphatase [Bacteroidota bacterium]